MFSDNELSRYSRQIIFEKIGKTGQQKLKNAKLAIVGLGGLGSAAAMILARAGIGYLRLIDNDIVELNNLQRQSLFDEADIGKPKASASAKRLCKINSEIKLDVIAEELTAKTARRILSGTDIILDCTDNMDARYAMNEFAIMRRIPFIYGAAVGSTGMASTIMPKKTACLNCIFPEIKGMESCAISGVLSAITSLIGAIQANEAIKCICGFGKTLSGKLFYADLSDMRFEISKIKKRSGCPVCGK